MNEIQKWSGVVALVVLAIIGLTKLLPQGSNVIAGSTSCGSITCLEGGLRLVSDVGGDFESDVAAVFGSTVNITGATSITGLATMGGFLSTASSTVNGRFTAVATTTLADTVSLTNPGLCVNFYATSTATQLHLTASTTGVLPNGAGAVMTADYGVCQN